MASAVHDRAGSGQKRVSEIFGHVAARRRDVEKPAERDQRQLGGERELQRLGNCKPRMLTLARCGRRGVQWRWSLQNRLIVRQDGMELLCAGNRGFFGGPAINRVNAGTNLGRMEDAPRETKFA
jgi:hypothetical protein